MNRFLFLISLCTTFLVSCQDEESTARKPLTPNAETILKSEYSTLLNKYFAESSDFNETLKNLKTEMLADAESGQATVKELQADETLKQAEISSLKESLAENQAKLNDCKEIGVALRAELEGAKNLGADEYADIFERSGNILHEDAIKLFEVFLEKYPTGSVARKARSRMDHHKRQLIIVKNRTFARPLRIWQSRFQAARLSTSTQARSALESLIGRKADSAKRGSSSEFKEITYFWRDYASDLSGGFRDLVVETVDDKITKVYSGETLSK
jgi:glutamine synthetase type III